MAYNIEIAFVNLDGTVVADGTLVSALTNDTQQTLVQNSVIGATPATPGQGSAFFSLLVPGTTYKFTFPNVIDDGYRILTIPDAPQIVVPTVAGANGTDGTDGAGATTTTSAISLGLHDTTINIPVENSAAFVYGQSVALNASDTLTYFGTVTSASNDIVNVNLYATNNAGDVQNGISVDSIIPSGSTLTFGNPPTVTTTVTTTTVSTSSILADSYAIPQTTTVTTYQTITEFGFTFTIPVSSYTTYPDGQSTSITVEDTSPFTVNDYIVVGPNDLSGPAVVICVTEINSSTNTITGTYQDYYVQNWNAQTLASGSPVTILTVPAGAITVVTGRVSASQFITLSVLDCNIEPYVNLGIFNPVDTSLISSLQTNVGGLNQTSLTGGLTSNFNSSIYAGSIVKSYASFTPEAPTILSTSYNSNSEILTLTVKVPLGASSINVNTYDTSGPATVYNFQGGFNTYTASLNLDEAPYTTTTPLSSVNIELPLPSYNSVYACQINVYAVDSSGLNNSPNSVIYFDGSKVSYIPILHTLPPVPKITYLEAGACQKFDGIVEGSVDDNANISQVFLPYGDGTQDLVLNLGYGLCAFPFTVPNLLNGYSYDNLPNLGLQPLFLGGFSFYTNAFSLGLPNAILVPANEDGFPETTTVLASAISTGETSNGLYFVQSPTFINKIPCSANQKFFLVFDASPFNTTIHNILQSDGWGSAQNEGPILVSSDGGTTWTIPTNEITYSGQSLEPYPPGVAVGAITGLAYINFELANNTILVSGTDILEINTYGLYANGIRTLLSSFSPFDTDTINPDDPALTNLAPNFSSSSSYTPNFITDVEAGLQAIELTSTNNAGESGPSSRVYVTPNGYSWEPPDNNSYANNQNTNSILTANYLVPQATTTQTISGYIDVPGFGEYPVFNPPVTVSPDGTLTSIIVNDVSLFAVGDYITVGPTDLSGTAVVLCITSINTSTNAISGTYHDYYVQDWSSSNQTIPSGSPVKKLTIPEGMLSVVTSKVSNTQFLTVPTLECNIEPYINLGFFNPITSTLAGSMQTTVGGYTQTNLTGVSTSNIYANIYAGNIVKPYQPFFPEAPVITNSSAASGILTLTVTVPLGAGTIISKVYDAQADSTINTVGNNGFANLSLSPYNANAPLSSIEITVGLASPNTEYQIEVYALDVSGNYQSDPAIIYWNGVTVADAPSILAIPPTPIIVSLNPYVGYAVADSNTVNSDGAVIRTNSNLPSGDGTENLVTNFGTGRVAFPFVMPTNLFDGLPPIAITRLFFISNVFSNENVTDAIIVAADENGLPTTTNLVSGSIGTPYGLTGVGGYDTGLLSYTIPCSGGQKFFLVCDATPFDGTITIPRTDGWVSSQNEGNILISPTGNGNWTVPSMTYAGQSIVSNGPATFVEAQTANAGIAFTFGNAIFNGNGINVKQYLLYSNGTRNLIGTTSIAANQLTPNATYGVQTQIDYLTVENGGILATELTSYNDAGESAPSSRVRVTSNGLSWL